MVNKANKFPYCPLVDKKVQDIECVENQDCIDGIIDIHSMPKKFKEKKDYANICKTCKYHEY